MPRNNKHKGRIQIPVAHHEVVRRQRLVANVPVRQGEGFVASMFEKPLRS